MFMVLYLKLIQIILKKLLVPALKTTPQLHYKDPVIITIYCELDPKLIYTLNILINKMN